MIVSTKTLFKKAYGKYAIGAYNVANLEQIMGLFQGNLDSQAPFIVALVGAAIQYSHLKMLGGLIQSANKIFPEAVFAVHHDHGSEESCLECIDSGIFTSVMIDASREDFETNIAITKRVVTSAHKKNIAVEAELGQIGGSEGNIQVKQSEAKLTDPLKAVEFVQRTGVDSLACAIGTSHGAFKFSGKSGLHFDLLKNIQKQLPGFPLVLHGASSVPQEEVRRINNTGGALQGANGVDPSQFKKAAELGIVKINIATDGRLLWTRVHREYLLARPECIDFRKPGKKFIQEYAQFVSEKNQQLGSAGKLSDFR